MVNVKQCRTYDKEFKREGVRLVVEEGRKATEVERNVGISKSTVTRWGRKMKEDPDNAFPGKGCLKPPDEKSELSDGSWNGSSVSVIS